MLIRVGVEGRRKTVLDRARELGSPILVSANSLWSDRRKQFCRTHCYDGFDLALDSGGFVAMKRYGRYRWTVRQYVELARFMQPTWWAQMDWCCEPQIASDQAEVWKRIDLTVGHLHECQEIAAGEGVARPMPVLQGWKPGDYIRGPAYDEPFEWPDLVGIGSVCRRHMKGPDGLMAVIEALHGAVPPHVQFHLFGVKSAAIAKLMEEFPGRIASMDSMAWNVEARWQATRAGGRDKDREAQVMVDWYNKQVAKARIQSISDQQLLLLLAGKTNER